MVQQLTRLLVWRFDLRQSNQYSLSPLNNNINFKKIASLFHGPPSNTTNFPRRHVQKYWKKLEIFLLTWQYKCNQQRLSRTKKNNKANSCSAVLLLKVSLCFSQHFSWRDAWIHGMQGECTISVFSNLLSSISALKHTTRMGVGLGEGGGGVP